MIELPPLNAGEKESIDAMRDQFVTDAEIAMVIAIARLTGTRIGEAAMTMLTARDQLNGYHAETGQRA